VPLLVDRDGAVLEAARANLFLARAGVLVTPPVDGRILPGTVGGRMVDIASALGLDVQESSFMKEDLIEADEVFLTGSVRGIVAVYDLDGTALQRKGEVTQRVTLEMRRRWLR
jgi:para-aminobenzoate synthetase/4-amino-4-deoxychorismate lyase